MLIVHIWFLHMRASLLADHDQPFSCFMCLLYNSTRIQWFVYYQRVTVLGNSPASFEGDVMPIISDKYPWISAQVDCLYLVLVYLYTSYLFVCRINRWCCFFSCQRHMRIQGKCSINTIDRWLRILLTVRNMMYIWKKKQWIKPILLSSYTTQYYVMWTLDEISAFTCLNVVLEFVPNPCISQFVLHGRYQRNVIGKPMYRFFYPECSLLIPNFECFRNLRFHLWKVAPWAMDCWQLVIVPQ
jgi:hypothetical protein